MDAGRRRRARQHRPHRGRDGRLDRGAADLGGTALWSGVTGATVVLGAAGGAVVLSAIMTRRGRRTGLWAGYAIGVVGAIVATMAVIGVSLPLLLLGTFLIGFGNASNQLSRYAAADMYPDSRRASAIGLVVWGATAGAIIGPNLVAPAGAFAAALGLPELAGPYLVPIIFVGSPPCCPGRCSGPTPISSPWTRPARTPPRRMRRSRSRSARCWPARTCRSRSSRWSPGRS